MGMLRKLFFAAVVVLTFNLTVPDPTKLDKESQGRTAKSESKSLIRNLVVKRKMAFGIDGVARSRRFTDTLEEECCGEVGDKSCSKYHTKYTCDKKTGRRFGCSLGFRCWRTCDLAEAGCFKKHWCYVTIGTCTYSSGCSEAARLPCYDKNSKVSHKLGKDVEGCPEQFKEQYCDPVTKRSYGCLSGGLRDSKCWRSTDMNEDKCWVNAGGCTFDKGCKIATLMICHN